MNEELDDLLCADEDTRVRLSAAREAARTQVASVRDALARQREEKKRQLAETLAKELAAIREASARRVEERRARREQYRAERRSATESLLPLAAEAFARVVRGDAGERPP